MQALLPLIALVAGCSGTHLTLLPYAYLAEPLPVYHQSQNTETGEHAYSYAGGPSAKEEVKGLDGVTRGSYSYVDANGILQSVFYVADEGGFRVAATNLPSDDHLPLQTADVLLAKRSLQEEDAKPSSRTRRSLEDESDQNSNQNREENKDSKESIDQSPAESIHAFVYQAPETILIPKLLATATSHQSQVQLHRNVKLEPEQLVKIEEQQQQQQQPIAVAAELATATSHQSQVQIHRNLKIELPEVAKAEQQPVEVVHSAVSPILPLTPLAYSIESVPVLSALPTYHANRIELHKSLGIEGAAAKDTVKIKTEPVAILEPAPAAAVPVVPSVLAKESAPLQAVPLLKARRISLAEEPATASVTTSISSHSISQIHGDSKPDTTLFVSDPALIWKSLPVLPQLQPLVSLPLLHTLPYAHAAHYRTQIHSK